MNSYLPKVLSERGFLPYEEKQESVLLKCINRYLFNELERAKRNGDDIKNISGFYKDMTNEDIEFFENSIFKRIMDAEVFGHDFFTMDMYQFSEEENINYSNIIVKLNNLSCAEIEIVSNSTSVLNSLIFPGYEITSIDRGYTYFDLKIHPGFVDACKAVFDEISTQTIPYHVEPERFISPEEVIILKQMIELFKQQKNNNIQTELIFNPETALLRPSVIDKEFNGRLQGTTMQLYAEVWEALDDFTKKYQLSKKAVVNQAIWEYLEKWGKIIE